MSDIQTTSEMFVTLEDHMGDDLSVVEAARVSVKGPRTDEVMDDSGKGLINFLMRNKHGTPFEHNRMKFRVRVPIFVLREWHRHRIEWSYNEESARYKQLEPLFYVPAEDRPLKQEGKPGHYVMVLGDEVDLTFTRNKLWEAYRMSYRNYEHMLEQGIAREVARDCLPTAIYSTMYASCNARTLMNFLSLRTHEPELANHVSKPLYEINVVAKKLEGHFAQLFPVTHAAFNANGREAP